MSQELCSVQYTTTHDRYAVVFSEVPNCSAGNYIDGFSLWPCCFVSVLLLLANRAGIDFSCVLVFVSSVAGMRLIEAYVDCKRSDLNVERMLVWSCDQFIFRTCFSLSQQNSFRYLSKLLLQKRTSSEHGGISIRYIGFIPPLCTLSHFQKVF